MKPDSEVVVTGLGVVSPIGIGIEPFWESLVGGVSGVQVREQFADTELPFRIAAPVTGFEPKQYVKPRKALKIMCDPIKFACAAAAMAVEQAGLQAGDDRNVDPNRIGTVVGTETFFADPCEVADVFHRCTVDKDYQHDRWGELAIREIQPLWMLKYLPNMAASHISIALDARGPSNSICQGEASSMLALIEAANLIRRGTVDVAIVGGTGSQMALTSMLYHGVENLSNNIHHPKAACRPFDRDRDGMVVGEGAGAIVIESQEHAKARGARAIARIAGYSSGYASVEGDAFGAAFKACLQESLQRADLNPAEIGFINANASGSVEGDAAEARALHAMFGECPVAANKGNFGNLGPGTSMVELIAGILSIENQTIPATLNFNAGDPDCPSFASSENRDLEQLRMVKSSISSMGQFASLVVSK